MEKWVLIGFPECQDYMEFQDFKENSHLNGDADVPEYFIKWTWYKRAKLKSRILKGDFPAGTLQLENEFNYSVILVPTGSEYELLTDAPYIENDSRIISSGTYVRAVYIDGCKPLRVGDLLLPTKRISKIRLDSNLDRYYISLSTVDYQS